jgi:hypothetical protein
LRAANAAVRAGSTASMGKGWSNFIPVLCLAPASSARPSIFS